MSLVTWNMHNNDLCPSLASISQAINPTIEVFSDVSFRCFIVFLTLQDVCTRAVEGRIYEYCWFPRGYCCHCLNGCYSLSNLINPLVGKGVFTGCRKWSVATQFCFPEYEYIFILFFFISPVIMIVLLSRIHFHFILFYFPSHHIIRGQI